MIRALVICCLLCATGVVRAQQPDAVPTDSFPALPQILAAIDSFYARQCAAQVQEFQDTKRGHWMQWMPQVGVGYVPALYPGQGDRLRPTISYSLSTVEQNLRKSEERKVKRLSLTDQCALDAQREKEKVWQMFQRRLLMIGQLRHQREVFQIDEQLYQFYTDEFQKVKIPADFYLGEKRKYLEKAFAIRQAEFAIQVLEAEILAAGHIAPIH